MQLDDFTTGYIECALWSSLDDEGGALDDEYADRELTDDAIARMAEECKQFQADNRALLDEAIDDYHASESELGHDFWLTRNHHGAGFWDRDYSKELGDALTAAAHKAGTRSLYVTDGGKIEHTDA